MSAKSAEMTFQLAPPDHNDYLNDDNNNEKGKKEKKEKKKIT